MSVRLHCDNCEARIPEGSPAIKAQPEFATLIPSRQMEGAEFEVGLKIHRSVGGVWNGGHLCGRCLGQALREALAEIEAGVETREPLRLSETEALERIERELDLERGRHVAGETSYARVRDQARLNSESIIHVLAMSLPDWRGTATHLRQILTRLDA